MEGIILGIILALILWHFHDDFNSYFYKKTGKVYVHNMVHISGIPTFDNGVKFELKLNQDILKFDKYELSISQINGIEITNSRMLIQNENNAMVGALFGGLLFGGVGAIAGGMSESGGNSSETLTILCINYKTKNGEEKVGLIGNSTYKSELKVIAEYINEKIGYEPKLNLDDYKI